MSAGSPGGRCCAGKVAGFLVRAHLAPAPGPVRHPVAHSAPAAPDRRAGPGAAAAAAPRAGPQRTPAATAPRQPHSYLVASITPSRKQGLSRRTGFIPTINQHDAFASSRDRPPPRTTRTSGRVSPQTLRAPYGKRFGVRMLLSLVNVFTRSRPRVPRRHERRRSRRWCCRPRSSPRTPWSRARPLPAGIFQPSVATSPTSGTRR